MEGAVRKSRYGRSSKEEQVWKEQGHVASWHRSIIRVQSIHYRCSDVTGTGSRKTLFCLCCTLTLQLTEILITYQRVRSPSAASDH